MGESLSITRSLENRYPVEGRVRSSMWQLQGHQQRNKDVGSVQTGKLFNEARRVWTFFESSRQPLGDLKQRVTWRGLEFRKTTRMSMWSRGWGGGSAKLRNKARVPKGGSQENVLAVNSPSLQKVSAELPQHARPTAKGWHCDSGPNPNLLGIQDPPQSFPTHLSSLSPSIPQQAPEKWTEGPFLVEWA